MRYTLKDVKSEFHRMTAAAERVGVNTDGWQVETGSQTYGRAWRLVRVDPTTGAHYDALRLRGDMGGTSYLGWSAQEACLTLTALTAAFTAAAEVQA